MCHPASSYLRNFTSSYYNFDCVCLNGRTVTEGRLCHQSHNPCNCGNGKTGYYTGKCGNEWNLATVGLPLVRVSGIAGTRKVNVDGFGPLKRRNQCTGPFKCGSKTGQCCYVVVLQKNGRRVCPDSCQQRAGTRCAFQFFPEKIVASSESSLASVLDECGLDPADDK